MGVEGQREWRERLSGRGREIGRKGSASVVGRERYGVRMEEWMLGEGNKEKEG